MAESELIDLTSTNFVVAEPRDITELFARGTRRAILLDTQFAPEFFDLSSGFAGDVVQKCVNYGIQVALVRATDQRYSEFFEQFAAESSRHGRFVFVRSIEEARAILKP